MLLLEGHTSPVYALAFSPDGRYLASGTKDGAVWLWDEGMDRQEYWMAEPGPEDPVTSIEFHPDGSTLVVTGRAGYVGRRSLPDGKFEVFIPERRANATAARFVTPELLAVGFGHRDKPEAGSFELWDFTAERRKEPCFAAPHGVRAVAVYPPLQRVAWSERGGSQSGPRLTVWDIVSPDQTRFNLTHNCPSLSFHPDGDRLAAAVEWGFKVFDLTRKQERLAIKGHTGIVSGVAYSPDGRTLATGSWDGTVCLWDPETGSRRACYQWPTGKVSALAYAPDGLRLAAAGANGTIAVWDVD